MINKSLSLLVIRHLIVFLGAVLPLQLVGATTLLVYLPVHLWLLKHGYKESIKLPYLLRWFDNADLYVFRNTTKYLQVFSSGYWNLYVWLAWRNPLNYFGYKILGFTVTNKLRVLEESNNQYEVGDLKHDGEYKVLLEQEGKYYFEYYRVIKYAFQGVRKCIRIRIGWKIQRTIDLGLGEHVQWVCSFKILNSYTGV